MKSKFVYLILGLVVVLAGVWLFLKFGKTPVVQKIHFHAGFIVFLNGQKVDFSDGKYMTIEPCKVNPNEKQTPAEIQHDKAHLHDGVGDVVHVHVPGAVWGDLFSNINYPIDYSKVTAFINGKEIPDIKNFPIKAYDSLVIFIGTVDKNLLSQTVTVDHIKEVESKSETCGN